MTVSFALLPGWTSGDDLPPIQKSWASLPLFASVKTILPCGTLDFESLREHGDRMRQPALIWPVTTNGRSDRGDSLPAD